jgi:uncharacterized membrane protein
VIARQAGLLAVLLEADVWSIITLATAILGGKGHGAVFWAAVALIAVITTFLIRWTIRVGRRFASRFAGPS